MADSRDDHKLLKSYIEGDKRSLESFYLRYKPDLFIYIQSCLANREATLDILQDTFMKVLQNPNNFLKAKNIKFYLFRCAHNLAVNYLRNKSKRISLKQEKLSKNEVILVSTHTTLNEPTPLEENHISIALLELPLEQRRAITLHIYGQLSFRQIGTMLSISPNTIYRQYLLGLDKLKKYFSKKGMTFDEET